MRSELPLAWEAAPHVREEGAPLAVRPAVPADLAAIPDVYERVRAFMRASGKAGRLSAAPR